MDFTFHSKQPVFSQSNSTLSLPSHSSLLDVTSESPTFPDAFQDKYLKSLGSSKSRSSGTSSRRLRHAPPQKKNVASDQHQFVHNPETHRSNSVHQKHSSFVPDEDRTVVDSKHFMDNLQRDNLPSSVRTTTRSEIRQSPRRMYSRPSHSTANSEPIQGNTMMNEGNMHQIHREECQYISNQGQASASRFVESPKHNPLSEQYNPNRHLNEEFRSNSLRQDQNISDGYSNTCYSEPLKKSGVEINSIRKSTSYGNDRMSFPPQQNSIHKNIGRNKNNQRWHHTNNPGPSFDDASTIPSEDIVDHFAQKRDILLSVPSSIRCSGGRNYPSSPVRYHDEQSKHHVAGTTSGRFFAHGSLHENRENLHVSISRDYTERDSTKESMGSRRNASSLLRMKHTTIQTESKNQRGNEVENYLPHEPSNASRSLSQKGSYSTIDIIPDCHTQPTVASSSFGSRSHALSDRYHSAEMDSTIHRNQENENLSHKQNSGTEKTPTSSNISPGFSLGAKEFNIQRHGRLEILQEIGISMEMKMKAKIAQEKGDYEFWVKHIEKLNTELERIKFSHEEESVKNNTSSKANNFSYSFDHLPKVNQSIPTQKTNDEVLSILKNRTNPDQDKPQQGKDKPISILKPPKSKTRIVKIRAPSDLSAGHVFSINFKGQEIKATVPVGGVSKGEVFPVTIPIASDSSSTSSPLTPTEKVTQQKNMVKVRAPADLEEGFIFTVKVKSGVVTAPVPKGGVKKGEIFLIPKG